MFVLYLKLQNIIPNVKILLTVLRIIKYEYCEKRHKYFIKNIFSNTT